MNVGRYSKNCISIIKLKSTQITTVKIDKRLHKIEHTENDAKYHPMVLEKKKKNLHRSHIDDVTNEETTKDDTNMIIQTIGQQQSVSTTRQV